MRSGAATWASDGWRRLVESIPAIIQIVVAAMAAYAFADFVLGHRTPLLTITVAAASLGFKRDARPLRVVRTAIGMTIGIVLSEIAVNLLGVGFWQVAVITLVSLAVARFFSAEPGFAATVLVQAAIVVLLPSPAGGPFVRTLDGVIGGVAALLATVLVPRDPRREAARAATTSIESFEEVLGMLVVALRGGDIASSAQALDLARTSQAPTDAWADSLGSALSVARISPFLRRYLPELQAQQALQRSMDLAWRNLRVVARRADYLLRDGRSRPAIADAAAQLQTGTALLRESFVDISTLPAARAAFVAIVRRLDPDEVMPHGTARDQGLVLALHPLLVDLLCATGMPLDEAQALLPAL
ncbi:FUSC family protein [Gryllotalpicola protaetiae]|uniref:FUSC family protein n=1 Tax=Gryllotalpicola protaetiae TaxID=2419771 RepID=A0A387BFP9_9MICO|nr:FUSC family protein [Gryllotalpicola protaetiae]AYG02845.1 FUSC family protein [Gryllotalpicola protaetiae]